MSSARLHLKRAFLTFRCMGLDACKWQEYYEDFHSTMCRTGGRLCYLWTLCLGRWILALLPAEPLRVFHGNDWWFFWSPRRRAKRNTCRSPVGCGKAPLCSSIKPPLPYLCTTKTKHKDSYCVVQECYTSSASTTSCRTPCSYQKSLNNFVKTLIYCNYTHTHTQTAVSGTARLSAWS